MINSLKDEQNIELEKSQEDFITNGFEIKNKLKHLDTRNDKEIEIIEEKFTYEIFNSIGNMFNVKNKKNI